MHSRCMHWHQMEAVAQWKKNDMPGRLFVGFEPCSSSIEAWFSGHKFMPPIPARPFWHFLTEDIRWNINKLCTRIHFSNEGCQGCCCCCCCKNLVFMWPYPSLKFDSTRLHYTLSQHSSWHNVASLGVASFCTIAITQMNLHVFDSVRYGVYYSIRHYFHCAVLYCCSSFNMRYLCSCAI